MIRNFLFALVLLLPAITCAAPSVKYTLEFEEPQTHYVKVKMEISNWSGQDCKVKLPVWTPGSYMVREFSRFLERLKVTTDGTELKTERFRKNGWAIKAGKVKNFTIEYYIYAYELTVRTAFIDADHAYLNGTAVFLYIDGFKDIPATVEVNPYKAWKKISVALDAVDKSNPWIVKADNYDALVDAPFEIGNHDVFSFTASGIPHEVAIFGNGYYDSTAIKRDLKAIAEEEAKIFGENPCKRYLFIVHLVGSGGGGLEHKNSTTIQVGRNSLTTSSGYNGFLSLAAHEYFHLWNVKRLRPAPLGPFDYDNENYTSLLYFAEGFTAYYDELVLVRCGLISGDAYIKTLAGSITSLENTPGNFIQPLSESGYDAWIKYYRSTENSLNATVSYYSKGSMMGALLDILLLDATDGKAGLDGLMKYMYDEYYKRKDRGFTDEELIIAAEKVCNCSIRNIFDKYIYDIKPVP
jgi:predicted metalloprotease with PDZ domain